MPKRRSDGRRRRQHLYLVLDDWRWGHSIRKVDLSSSFDPDPAAVPGETEAEIDYTERRLRRAVVRVEAPRGAPWCFAPGPGSTIMAMHRYDARAHPLALGRLVPTFDVRTRAVACVPRPKARDPARAVYVPVGGDLLLVLAPGSFEELCPPPPGGARPASWELQMPSFDPRGVASFAVHPDGRTVFFSTFAFDASPDDDEDGGGMFRWTRCGGWTLPFAGRVHYDRALDAWVGLSTDPDAFGRVCACDVVAPDAATTWSYDGEAQRQLHPARKLSRENLLVGEDPSERHARARGRTRGQVLRGGGIR